MNTSPACKSLSPACQRGESLIAIGDIINTIGHITYNSAHDQWPDGLTRGELTTAFDSLESAVAHARELHGLPARTGDEKFQAAIKASFAAIQTMAAENAALRAKPSAMDCGGSATPLSEDGLATIGEQISTQDNRCTSNPMFCVQIRRRDDGYHADFASGKCWWNGNGEVIYDDDKDFKSPPGKGWSAYGYVDRWETVAVTFTEHGAKRYLDLDGHNCRSRAHRGEVRIYVESWNRNPEMLAIRDALILLRASAPPRETVPALTSAL